MSDSITRGKHQFLFTLRSYEGESTENCEYLDIYIYIYIYVCVCVFVCVCVNM